MEKAPDAFRTISEVAEDLDVPQHVLRFWESRFSQLKPLKRGGGRRYYRPDDIDLLRGIRHLLYGEGYTIRGVQRLLKDNGARFVQGVWKRDRKDPAAPQMATAAQAPDEAEAEDQEGTGNSGEDDEEEPAEAAAPAPPAPAPPRIMPRATPRPVVPTPPPRTPALNVEDLRRLQAALYELSECRRLLDAALKGE